MGQTKQTRLLQLLGGVGRHLQRHSSEASPGLVLLLTGYIHWKVATFIPSGWSARGKKQQIRVRDVERYVSWPHAVYPASRPYIDRSVNDCKPGLDVRRRKGH